MRTLVTGASGFIGASLSQRLLNDGHDVTSIQHDIRPDNVAGLLGIYDDISWCNGDIRDEQLIKRIISDYDIEMVYHLAALPIVEMGMRSCRPMFEVNFMGTLSVLEALREKKDTGLLYVATDKVYGPMQYDRPYQEADPLMANAPYELSKACADMTVRMYHNMEYLTNVVVVRPSNEYGPGDMNPRIIPNTIRRCIVGESPIIYDGVTYTREFTYVHDTVDAMMLLTYNLRNHPEKGISGQAFNIGSGIQKNQNQVIEEILKHFPGLKPEVRPPKAYTRKEIPYQVVANQKIRELGWESTTSFEAGIAQTVDWWTEGELY